MSNYLESIFDNKNIEKYKLWENKSKKYNENKEVILNIGYFSKISTKDKKWKTRIFILTHNYLYYKKEDNDNKIRGILKNKGVRVEYLKNDSSNENEFNFGIRLIKNFKFSELWCAKSEFINWKKHFDKIFIQINFHDKYNPIKMIGKGSFARVYLIESNENKNKFACKAFSKDYLKNQEKGRESLLNEIEILKKINHENVIELIEIHETDNSIYLVLELLKGGELFDYILEKGILKPDEYYKIIYNILKALVYLNKQGIMHRDLKPENLIFKSEVKDFNNLDIKIIDFGLASNYNKSKILFKKCGTPGFVAPEILNNDPYDSKCDIFSLGVIFYILIVGESPFIGEDYNDVIKKNKNCEIDFNILKLKKYPKLLDLLKSMLEINPENRFSAEDCLNHIFFKNQESIKEIDTNFSKEDYDNYLKNKNNIVIDTKENYSLKMKEKLINGKIDTVHDSYAESLNENKKGGKRESIFKKINDKTITSNRIIEQYNNDLELSKNNSDFSLDED